MTRVASRFQKRNGVAAGVRVAAQVALLMLAACNIGPENAPLVYPTYNPFIAGGATPGVGSSASNFADGSGPVRGPTPTKAGLSVTVPQTAAGATLRTPTPDAPHALPTLRTDPNIYTVQPGDTLGSIAEAFGVGAGEIAEMNHVQNSDLLDVGMVLRVPAPTPGSPGSGFKILPDSEFVDGPSAAQFDTANFIASEAGYLSTYTEVLDTETLSGDEIIERIAKDYSVSPRVLLAVVEHRSQWVTNFSPAQTSLDSPLGLGLPNRQGLYHELAWVANELNRGFYLWRAGAVGSWVLHDGSLVPIDASINAGTAAAQSLFAALDDRVAWDSDVSAFGFFQTYFFLFGNPFDHSIEPLIPIGLKQPALILPFEPGSIWAFTGGPHAAWDSGSAWAALDFAPSDVSGCAVSAQWITAAADGFVVRTGRGEVIQDLDGDGHEETGWNILYMHVFSQDRVLPGTYLYAGDRIGHPSCEGGIANAAHLHLARKYNGEWISADQGLPFNLSGWVSRGTGTEYDGQLVRGSASLEAAEGITDQNQIGR
jgi:LasA protease